MKSRKSAVWFTRINLELRSTVNGLSVKRLPTVSLPTLQGPHSSPMCSPTAKYRLTSELRCLWETVCSVESHVPLQEAHCHYSWELVGRVGRHSSCRKKTQQLAFELWLLMSTVSLFTVWGYVSRYSPTRKVWTFYRYLWEGFVSSLKLFKLFQGGRQSAGDGPQQHLQEGEASGREAGWAVPDSARDCQRSG